MTIIALVYIVTNTNNFKTFRVPLPWPSLRLFSLYLSLVYYLDCFDICLCKCIIPLQNQRWLTMCPTGNCMTICPTVLFLLCTTDLVIDVRAYEWFYIANAARLGTFQIFSLLNVDFYVIWIYLVLHANVVWQFDKHE